MNSRPPPPDGRPPPAYTMVSRVYKSSLRPVVIITGLITAGWSLAWAIGAFQDINVDKDHGKPKFATLDIVLGTLYITACVIELFGVTAASMQNHLLVRIYSWLSVVSGLNVVTAGFIRVVTHFTFKNDLISECSDIVQGKDVVYRFGIWGPTIRDTLSPDEAERFCKNGWTNDSWREIISLLVELVLAGMFVAIAFAYYRQVLDPTSPANATRAPSAQHRMAAMQQQQQPVPPQFPDHYNPPYMAYNAPFAPPPAGAPYAGPYAPPAGPPPDFGKPPMYSGGEDRDAKDDKEDPFADFESREGRPGESRDRLV